MRRKRALLLRVTGLSFPEIHKLFLTLHLPETGSALKSEDGEGPKTSPEAPFKDGSSETSFSINAGKSLSNVYVDCTNGMQ